METTGTVYTTSECLLMEDVFARYNGALYTLEPGEGGLLRLKKKHEFQRNLREKQKFIKGVTVYHCPVCDEHFKHTLELTLHLSSGNHFMSAMDKYGLREVPISDAYFDSSDHDKFNPLLGLEYIVELIIRDEDSENDGNDVFVQLYRCFLCNDNVQKTNVFGHVFSYVHKKHYLKRHCKAEYGQVDNEMRDQDFRGTTNHDRKYKIAALARKMYATPEHSRTLIKQCEYFIKKKDMGIVFSIGVKEKVVIHEITAKLRSLKMKGRQHSEMTMAKYGNQGMQYQQDFGPQRPMGGGALGKRWREDDGYEAMGPVTMGMGRNRQLGMGTRGGMGMRGDFGMEEMGMGMKRSRGMQGMGMGGTGMGEMGMGMEGGRGMQGMGMRGTGMGEMGMGMKRGRGMQGMGITDMGMEDKYYDDGMGMGMQGQWGMGMQQQGMKRGRGMGLEMEEEEYFDDGMGMQKMGMQGMGRSDRGMGKQGSMGMSMKGTGMQTGMGMQQRRGMGMEQGMGMQQWQGMQGGMGIKDEYMDEDMAMGGYAGQGMGMERGMGMGGMQGSMGRQGGMGMSAQGGLAGRKNMQMGGFMEGGEEQDKSSIAYKAKLLKKVAEMSEKDITLMLGIAGAISDAD